MEPLTAMLIGSAIGLGKSALIDAPKERRQRELAARTIELSPWTGLKANGIEEADPFGSGLQFGLTGASMADAESEKAFKKQLAASLAGNLVEKKNPYTPYDVELQKPQYQLQPASSYSYLKGE